MSEVCAACNGNKTNKVWFNESGAVVTDTQEGELFLFKLIPCWVCDGSGVDFHGVLSEKVEDCNCTPTEYEDVAVSLYHENEKVSETVFNALKKVLNATEIHDSAYSEIDDDRTHIINGHLVLKIRDGGWFITKTSEEILGKSLVLDIREGYTPWFDGDSPPEGMVNIRTKSGRHGELYIFDNVFKGDSVRSYKKKPSIESRVLAEKAGSSSLINNFDLDDQAKALCAGRSSYDLAREVLKLRAELKKP